MPFQYFYIPGCRHLGIYTVLLRSGEEVFFCDTTIVTESTENPFCFMEQGKGRIELL